MSPETPKPSSPEMYVIPTAQTDALEQARIDAQEFKNTVEASRTFIDVTDVPGHEERLEVAHPVSTEVKHSLGDTALAAAKEVVPIESPTPQQMRSAIGSPYYQDRLGRIAPKEQE